MPFRRGGGDREDERRRSEGASRRGEGERDIELRFRELLPPAARSARSGVGRRAAECIVAAIVP